MAVSTRAKSISKSDHSNQKTQSQTQKNTKSKKGQQNVAEMAKSSTKSEYPDENPDIEQLFEDQILSPRASIDDLQQRSSLKTQFSDWIEVIEGSKSRNTQKVNFVSPPLVMQLNHDMNNRI